jgi:N utilization substance protein B
MLFQLDLTAGTPTGVFDEFWSNREASDETREFAERLVWGVHEARRELDRLISGSAEHWRIDRMAVVDRNVLRMAIYEMLTERETPSPVIIDEAIEVAKRFGSGESGGFINGVLDAIRLRVERGEIHELSPGGGSG